MGIIIILIILGIIALSIFIALMPLLTYLNTRKALREIRALQDQLVFQQNELKNALFRIHEYTKPNHKNTPR